MGATLDWIQSLPQTVQEKLAEQIPSLKNVLNPTPQSDSSTLDAIVPPTMGAKFTAPAATLAPTPAPRPATSSSGSEGGDAIAMALSGLGDAFAARGGQNTDALAKTTALIQGRPKLALEKKQLEQQSSLMEGEADPNSATSRAHQQYMIKLGADPETVKGLSATQLAPMEALHEKVYGIDATTKERLLAAQIAADQRTQTSKENRLSREATLSAGQSNRDATLALRGDQQQDRIEQNAIARLSSIRGDSSMARIEQQRDAAIQAMDTIKNIKNGTLTNSGAVYNDLLGQLWRARTGSTPTDQVMQHLNDKTAKGDLAGAFTYITGSPAGKTTQEIMKNLENFVKTTGQKADKMHDAYMSTHLIKPTGLDDDRWQNIVKTHRGQSFAEAAQDQGPESAGQVLTATNPTTKEKIKSVDGGKTWQPAQ